MSSCNTIHYSSCQQLDQAQKKAPEHQDRGQRPELSYHSQMYHSWPLSTCFSKPWIPSPSPRSITKTLLLLHLPDCKWTFDHQSLATLCLGPMSDMGPHLLCVNIDTSALQNQRSRIFTGLPALLFAFFSTFPICSL